MLSLPKLIGHRGVKNLSPENTLNSIRLANKLGLEWVEIDVKISKDSIPILFHDDSLNRTTNGDGLPIDFNYRDLKKLDAGSFFYNYPTDIYIPTLNEVLNFIQKNNMGINIELKPNLGFEEKNVKSIYNILKNINFTNQYYFSSFDWDSIIMMKKIMPHAFYGILIDKLNDDISIKKIIDTCKKNNISCCGFNINIINYDVIETMKAHNLIITIFSEKNLKIREANDLWLSGVNSIFIDDPSGFVA